MNRVILVGRLVRDPDVRYSTGNNQMAIARYTLAVDRRQSRSNANGGNNNEQTADFISCIAFGKSAEFAEKYLRKGIKLAITGRIQTGSYTNKEGQKVYTTDVVIEDQEFVESKNSSGQDQSNSGNNNYDRNGSNGSNSSNNGNRGGYSGNGRGANQQPQTDSNGFMMIPDGFEDELPFA